MQHFAFVLAVGSFALVTGCGTDSTLSPRTGRLANNARGGSPDPTTSFYAGANNATEIGTSWMDNSPNESGWEIHRSTNGATGNFTLRATVAANSTGYVDAGLTPLTDYCYKVRSFRKSGPNSNYAAFFNTSCATTYGPPPAASALDAIPRDYAQVDVVWTDNSSTESGFRLERAGALDGPWTNLGSLPPNTMSYRDSGRPVEQLICYRVIPVNQWGDGSPSNVDCTAFPAPPSQLVAASHDAQSIDLTWQDNSAFEDGFELQRGGAGIPFTVIANVGANVTSFNDTGVVPETQYSYFVRAKKEGAFSSYVSTTGVVITGPPAAPSIDAVPSGSTTVYVSWWAGSVTTQGGRIERKDNGIWSVVSGPAADPSFFDYGRTAEQEVCYRAIAHNSLGDSPPSAEDCATPPAAPTNVTVTIVDAVTNEVSWTDNSNVEEAYELTFTWTYCWDEWYCEYGYYTIWTEPNATTYQYTNADTFVGITAVNDGGYSDGGTGPAFGNIVAGAGIRAAPKMGSRPPVIAPTGRPAKLNGIARSAKKPISRIPK